MAEEWNQQIVGVGQEDQEVPRPRPVNPILKRAWKDVTQEPMPPASPYHLFYQEEQAQLQGVECVFVLRRSRRKSDGARMRQPTRTSDTTPADTPEERAAQRSTRTDPLTERWRCLPQADKERYNDMHALAREEYRQDMERYIDTMQLFLAKSESKKELLRKQNERDELRPPEASPRSDSSSESHNADRFRSLLNVTRTSFRDLWMSANLRI